MPTITEDNDRYAMRVQVKRKGWIYVDAAELSEQFAYSFGSTPADGDLHARYDAIAELMRGICWAETPTEPPQPMPLDTYTDSELWAVAAKVMLALEDLGKERGASADTSPSTDSCHPSASAATASRASAR